MGFFTGLLTLPFAPVRGVVWIGEQVQEVAERELYDPTVIRQRLTEVAEAREDGEISEEEANDLEEELVRRLLSAGPPSSGLEV